MLNTKSLKIIVLIFALALPGIFTSSCYQDEGDAVVTIHLERNDLAAMGIKPEKHLGIIDRILTLFSTRAEAAPVIWPSGKSTLTLTITSDSFSTKIFTIPPLETSYSVTLPAGGTATLTITSEADWEFYVVGPNQKNWGGHITTELKYGKQDIIIQMLPMTYIVSVNPPSTVSVDFVYDDGNDIVSSFVTAYKVYRSATIDGEYSYLTTTTTSPVIDTGASGRYYYRVSTVCDLGDSILREGVLSDPKTW